jgi:hypothetical protein
MSINLSPSPSTTTTPYFPFFPYFSENYETTFPSFPTFPKITRLGSHCSDPDSQHVTGQCMLGLHWCQFSECTYQESAKTPRAMHSHSIAGASTDNLPTKAIASRSCAGSRRAALQKLVGRNESITGLKNKAKRRGWQ